MCSGERTTHYSEVQRTRATTFHTHKSTVTHLPCVLLRVPSNLAPNAKRPQAVALGPDLQSCSKLVADSTAQHSTALGTQIFGN